MVFGADWLGLLALGVGEGRLEAPRVLRVYDSLALVKCL